MNRQDKLIITLEITLLIMLGLVATGIICYEYREKNKIIKEMELPSITYENMSVEFLQGMKHHKGTE